MEYVEKTEFNQLKEEVNDIKKEMAESKVLLHEIDKKIDVITTKIIDADKIKELELKALKEEVKVQKEEIKEIKDNQKWLRRTILSSVIVMVFEAIGLVFAFLK